MSVDVHFTPKSGHSGCHQTKTQDVAGLISHERKMTGIAIRWLAGELCRPAPSRNGFSCGATPCSELFAKMFPGGYPEAVCEAVNSDLMDLPANIDCKF